MASTTPQHRPTGFWTTRRLVVTFIALALLLSFGVSSCTQTTNVVTTNSNASPPTPKATNAAPARNAGTVPSIPLPAGLLETRLTTIDGQSFKLSDYKGKVVIINLWASWCGPCRIETPELVRMSQEYKARGVEFIGLTTRQNDPDLEPIKDFLREQQVTYKTVYDDGTFAGPLSQAVRARAVIPQSYVISRDGNILKHFEGFSAEQTPTLMRQAIEQALEL